MSVDGAPSYYCGECYLPEVTPSAFSPHRRIMMAKVLVSHLQIIGMISLFPLKWPSAVETFFYTSETVTASGDVLSLDCAPFESPSRCTNVLCQSTLRIFVKTSTLFVLY